MTLDTWLTFVILELLICMTPGPAVMFVTTTASERGAKAAVIGTSGILISNVMYFVISGTGVAAVLVASPTLFEILRWAGSGYLLFLGSRLLLTRTSTAAAQDPAQANISLLHGFMVQTLNPKAIAFFVALYPQFIDPAAALAPQLLILTGTSLVIEAGVMASYIVLTIHYGKRAGRRGKIWFRRLGGAFLIVAAVRLFF